MNKREIYFDNLKAVLIFLVVLGHFTNLNINIPLLGALNNVIYSFHMPIFIFIFGYFSKSINSQRASEIENVLYPYVVFQIINMFYTKITGLGFGSLNIFDPTYQNWYLLGLFIWRLLIPYYEFFNRMCLFIITLLITFSIGFVDGFNTFLGLYRILYFFPFFIVGYYCGDLEQLINKFLKYKYVFIAITFFCLFTVFFASFFSSNMTKEISLAFTPYSNYNQSNKILLLRLIGFFSSFLISFGILYIIPRHKTKISYIGLNSMNIFLAHMFFVFPINYYFKNLPSILLLSISIIFSILICFILSNSLVNKILNPLTSLKKSIMLFKNHS